MNWNRVSMEKLDRTIGAHLRRVNAAGRLDGVVNLTGVCRYLAGMPLKDREVSLLLRYPNLREAALTSWKRDSSGHVQDLRFLLLETEAEEARPLLIAGVRLPSSWHETSRKRRDTLTGNQQTLYGDEGRRSMEGR